MPPKKVLVAEDDPNSMHLASVLLKMKDYVVFEATTGKQTVALALAEKPDLILMDIELPDINGQDAIKILRQHPETKDIPIVAVTGYASAGDRERFFAAGCDGYITKPLDAKKFLVDVAVFLNETPSAQSS